MALALVAAAAGLAGPLVSLPRPMPAAARPAVARISMQLEPSEEVSAAFRSLGIGEDESYDGIMAAYETLKAKNAGNTKAVIKLEVAKDRVMDHRLRQRMSGSLKPDRKFGEDLRPKDAKKPLITLPPFLEEIAELPKRTYLVTNIAVFGIFGLLPVFEASFVSSSIGLNFGIAMFRLYNRGAPETGNDEDMAMRPVNKRASFLTFGICGLATALGGLLGQLLKPLLFFLSESAAISLGASAALCFACSFFKVQGE